MVSDRFDVDWTDETPVAGSFRSIFKMGGAGDIRVPSESHFELLAEELGLGPEDLGEKRDGNEAVRLEVPVGLGADVVEMLGGIVGAENVQVDAYSRVKYGHGKLQEEMLLLRRGVVGKAPDVVVHPRSKEEVEALVGFCDGRGIPMYVYSGGSSVNFGLRAEKGGVTVVLSTHLNKVLEVNEKNQTARVQAGCMGPDFEGALNDAPALYGTAHRYTCGHFPQSFELSSVGGWVLTLGSGQASTYYGDAAAMALGMEIVTPAGTLRTQEYPSTATGPKVLDMLKGSEGAFGIVTELTVKIFRYMPENRQYFGYLFPSWADAVEATRAISQGEFGLPAVLRISDGEETKHGLRMSGLSSMAERYLRWRGYVEGQRCGCIGTVEGDAAHTRLVRKKIHRIAKRHGAMSLGEKPAREWEKERYKTFLVAEALLDYGIVFDTVETPVRWDNLERIHTEVRAYANGVPNSICLSHASHFYGSGTNLYFIFALKGSVEAYSAFRTGIIDAMVRAGGSPSHHHGVGRLLAPWIESYLGKGEMDVLRALKQHFDPKGIMNPGGQLGLDLPEELRRSTGAKGRD